MGKAIVRSRSTQIISIFGQCERVAANILAAKYNLHKIEPKDFPPTETQIKDGVQVSFAIVMPARHMGEFISLCMDMRF